MIEFIGASNPWKWTTSGERLLFLLFHHHREYDVLVEALGAAQLRLGGRFADMSNFFVGTTLLHLLQRMVKLAKDVRSEEDTRFDQVRELRRRLCNILIGPHEYRGNIDELVQEALTSAEQSDKELTQGLKRRVERDGPSHCYSCGREFGVTPEGQDEPLEHTADHVWPRALGGDGAAENLLSACLPCNNAKEHLAAWQMAWLQPAVFSESDGKDGLTGLRRETRIALHMRAAMMYSHRNGSTLRDAYLAIGPRIDPVRIDEYQGFDFFNLRVHDESRANVRWTPS